MAKQMAQNGLAGKLGNRLNKAVDAHKDDEIKLPGGGSLPEGIENGIAQLVDCRFGVYESGDFKGEYFFYAAGVVHEPKIHMLNGVPIPVEGQRTNIGPEPICDTPKRTSRPTVEDHVAWVLNEMRKLGLDTTGLTGEDLEAAAAALVEAAPFFTFRTWKGEATAQYPNPQVNQTWVRQVDYEGSSDPEVVDNSAPEPTPPPKAAPKAAPAKAAAAPKAAPAKPPAAKAAPEAKTPPPAPEPVEEEEEDLMALGEAADAQDAEAAGRLNELCEAAGIDSSVIATWTEVAAVLLAGAEGDDGGAGSEEAATEGGEVPAPQVGEVYYYKAPKAAAAAECEVKTVDEAKQLCSLQDYTTKGIYRGVAWTSLQDAP